MDAVFNSRGRKLIDMATSQNLKILNGAIIGEAQGAFTCATYNGTCNGHQDVFEINTILTKTIQDVASSTLTRKKTNNKKHHNNNVWFDLECRKSKRKTDKLAKKHYKIPNQENRDNYFTQRKLTVLSSYGRKGNSLPPSIAISIKKEILIGRASKS